MGKDTSFSIRIDSALLDQVRQVARVRDEQISQVVRRYFREYVGRAPVQADLEDAVAAAEKGFRKRKAGRSS